MRDLGRVGQQRQQRRQPARVVTGEAAGAGPGYPLGIDRMVMRPTRCAIRHLSPLSITNLRSTRV
jgi:hypothetical protein